jgi:hypothetical protein
MVWGAPCANALGPVDALIDTSAMPTETIGTSGPLLSRQQARRPAATAIVTGAYPTSWARSRVVA